MLQYARIENDIIRELAEFASIEGRFAPWMQWIDVSAISGAAVGQHIVSYTPLVVRDPTPYEQSGALAGATNLEADTLALAGSDAPTCITVQASTTQGSEPLQEWFSASGARLAFLDAGGNFNLTRGSWDGPHLILGAYHFWVDRDGQLRTSRGTPTRDADGTLVGM